MNGGWVQVLWAGLLASALVACGGGSGGSSTPDTGGTPPPTSAQVREAIAAAARDPANDSAINPNSAFAVLQRAGVPAVTISGGVVRANFTVFSDGAVKTGLTIADVSFALARRVPATVQDPEQWFSYISRRVVAAAGVGPGGAVVPPAVAQQASNDPKTGEAQLTFNADGYYTYTFTARATDAGWTATIGGVDYSIAGPAFDAAATQRVAIQLAYRNAAGAPVRANPNYDFTFTGSLASTPLTNPATQTLIVSRVPLCNTCHERLAAHGGGRVEMEYCVMCHNSGTTDPESGNVLAMSTMTHKIHSGRLLSSVPGGEDYVVYGFRNMQFDYSESGFPQDLRNCTVCHDGPTPQAPQGDFWRTRVNQQACLTCHASNPGSTFYEAHALIPGLPSDPRTIPNAECFGCHQPGTALSAARTHFNQAQLHAARYRMNVTEAVFDAARRVVTVRYSLSDPTTGDRRYNLTEGCPSSGGVPVCGTDNRFGNLRLYLAYQNVVGQPTAVTEFSAYNNGGAVARVDAWRGSNDGSNGYTAEIALPADGAFAQAVGSGRIVTVGQVREVALSAISTADPRPPALPERLVNVGVQHTFRDLALIGPVQPPPAVASTDKCNVCHGLLGTASGANTLVNAFHDGARNTVQSCALCHDANRSSSTVMTNGATLPDGSPMREQFQSKYMAHGIHGNSRRTYPYTHGNLVFGKFDKNCVSIADPAVTCSPGTINYAVVAVWPGPTVDGQVQVNCNACHIDNSYEFDRSVLGAVVSPRPAGSNPLNWNAITPKAASCVSCHNSDFAVNHVLTAGNSRYGSATQAVSLQLNETCADCHSPTGFLSVRSAHNLK